MKFIKTTLDDRWDRFVESSPQGSIFSTSVFLRATGYNVDAYYVMKGNQVLGGFVGIEKDGSIIQAPHVIHSGVLFSGDNGDKNLSQVTALQFEITTFIIEEITKLYKNIEFNLPLLFKDVRPFLWHNFNGRPKFKIEIRYTSLIWTDPIIGYSDKLLNNSRRELIRKSTSKTIQLYIPDALVLYYKYNMELQGIIADTLVMSSVMDALNKTGQLKMYVTTTKEDVGNIIAFGVWGKSAYALYSGGKRKDCASVGLWNALMDLRASGIDMVDLEGINSPKRGAFKLSFGGSITPYYQVKLTP